MRFQRLEAQVIEHKYVSQQRYKCKYDKQFRVTTRFVQSDMVLLKLSHYLQRNFSHKRNVRRGLQWATDPYSQTLLCHFRSAACYCYQWESHQQHDFYWFGYILTWFTTSRNIAKSANRQYTGNKTLVTGNGCYHEDTFPNPPIRSKPLIKLFDSLPLARTCVM